MREIVKVLLAFVFVVVGIVAFFAWFDDRPTPTIWCLRLGAPPVALLMLWGLLAIHLKRDLVPDYLRHRNGTYFNRDGFSFVFDLVNSDGILQLLVAFQNQRDMPCTGTIGLRPASGFFLRRPKMEAITCKIECEPAAFGTARVPISIPVKLRGKIVRFEVGASGTYFEGKGKRVRFHDGIRVRANPNFRDTFGTFLAVSAVLTGMVILIRPVTVQFRLPVETGLGTSANSTAEVVTVWRLGDPPLVRQT